MPMKRVKTVAAVCVLASLSVLRAQVPQSSAEFRAASDAQKQAALVAIGQRASNPSLDVFKEIVTAGLMDSAVRTRRNALNVITNRSISMRNMPIDARRGLVDEKATLADLMPAALHALEDEDSSVRMDAIVAIGNLDFALSPTDGPMQVSLRAGTALARAYDVEKNPAVRGQLVKSFALMSGPAAVPTQAIGDALIGKALDDPNDYARATAITGVGVRHIAALLPKLAKFLKAPSSEVRLQAAQTFARFGKEAQPYVTDLRAAAAVETDEVVKKTLLGTIRVITGAK